MLVDGDVRITGDLEFDDAFIDELNFNVGIGTSLYVGFISATDGTIGGAGIATLTPCMTAPRRRCNGAAASPWRRDAKQTEKTG